MITGPIRTFSFVLLGVSVASILLARVVAAWRRQNRRGTYRAGLRRWLSIRRMP